MRLSESSNEHINQFFVELKFAKLANKVGWALAIAGLSAVSIVQAGCVGGRATQLFFTHVAREPIIAFANTISIYIVVQITTIWIVNHALAAIVAVVVNHIAYGA